MRRRIGGWRNLPLVNVIYDLLFDLPPTPEQLKESLNLIGLISALVLTMVGAAPYTGTDYAAHIAEVGTSDVYDKFVFFTTFSYAGLSASLFGVVVMLLFMHVKILQNTSFFQIERTALHSYGPDPHSR